MVQLGQLPVLNWGGLKLPVSHFVQLRARPDGDDGLYQGIRIDEAELEHLPR